jgi:DNA-binding MarR family transcriptional regulator
MRRTAPSDESPRRTASAGEAAPRRDADPPPPDRPGRPLRFDSVEQEAFLALWRTYDRLNAVEEELLASVELSPQQYNTLRLLRAAHPRRLPTLSIPGRLISRAPDVSRLLDKLEARGLVDRCKTDSDRRRILVGITRAGSAVLERLDGAIVECHRRQLGHLSRSQLKSLIELLREARLPHEPPESPWR